MRKALLYGGYLKSIMGKNKGNFVKVVHFQAFKRSTLLLGKKFIQMYTEQFVTVLKSEGFPGDILRAAVTN